ncbi:class I SAM-dependent methyltransferase [Streptomyces nitrosporeus]|uniref:class I SAM-dependent methyltransferase n=1 Tax=Streptomyces nitrosporeus TaxID=28894 RepID=UPI00167ED5CB|nr:class I SAM-dependent methyltransferase [Streptomyces nitrosporeus]GGZ20039.1 hypothetical protein GCM10010327_59050 [Streptomyces nitrosporeus]
MSQPAIRPPSAFSAERRQHLGASFDSLAEHYTSGRPTYPADFVEKLLQPLLARTPRPETVLEVGAGTGQATGLLARHFARVTAIEPGAKLSQEAAERYSSDRRVSVHGARFEDWVTTRQYDCVFSASAFHWADPSVSYEKAAAFLKPTGILAFISYTDVIGDESWEETAEGIREIYRTHAPNLTPPFGTRTFDDLTSTLRQPEATIAQALEYVEFGTARAVEVLPMKHLFASPQVLIERQDRAFTSDSIVAALASYGGFRGLDAETARRLAMGIRTYVEDERDNHITRPFALIGLTAATRRTSV